MNRADLVVFSDDARTRPYAVIECKCDAITNTELAQTLEARVRDYPVDW